MVTIEEFESKLSFTNPDLYAELKQLQGAGAGLSGSGNALPKGIEQLTGGFEKFMPIIEQITGKSRARLTTDLGWAVAHNKLGEFIGGLIPGVGGDSAPSVSKKTIDFTYYLRAVGIWIPLLVLFFGVVVIVLIGLFRFMIGVT